MGFVKYEVLKTVDNYDELASEAEKLGLTGDAKSKYIKSRYVFKGLIFGERSVVDHLGSPHQSRD